MTTKVTPGGVLHSLPKKIGILTFQRAINYGAMLQMYALQKMIKKLGAEAEIIDYDCPRISEGYRAFAFRALYHPRLFIHTLLNFVIQHNRNQKFEKFEKQHMTFSFKMKKNELVKASDSYDAYIVGSDQVWNPLITGGDTAYFLDFVKENRKKFSYAASFGVSSWPKNYDVPVGRLLEAFHWISTREKTGAEIVRDVTAKMPPLTVAVDPVFLLKKETWQKFVKSELVKTPYIFVYVVGSGNQEEVYQCARKLAKEKNLPIINLRYAKSMRHKGFKIGHVVYNVGPDEFVSYIGNAAYVVTDSFHATAFSTIFHKEMYVSKPGKVSSRITDLFATVGIEGRFIGESVKDISWEKVDQKLELARKDSLKYLKQIVDM